MENNNDTHGGHRDRLRQRVLEGGLEKLEPHEIIEYLLYPVIPRQDVNELSHALLDEFGSLEGVLRAEVPHLARVRGLGRHAATWLALVGELELAYRAAHDGGERAPINCFLDIYRYAFRMERQTPPPCTMQLCLDAEGGILHRRSMPSRAWGEAMYLREMTLDVLQTNAAGVVLLQFVGNESTEPGKYDIAHARGYSHVLEAAGCALLDIVLAGHGDAVSMRQRGLVPEYPLGEFAQGLRESYDRDLPQLARLRPEDFEIRTIDGGMI